LQVTYYNSTLEKPPMSDVQLANRDQVALWNETSGTIWVEMQAVLDRMLAPFADLVVENGFPGEGSRVLDIGCGAGATTLAMARRLGASCGCVGVDISAPLLAAARSHAAASGLASATFVQADAQTHAFARESFDAVISRFGVMFFDDPEAAFANMRNAVRRGAKLTFAAWRSPAENPFMTTAARAAAPILPNLKTPPPDAPGQFAFADGERVRRILESSGWNDINLRAVDIPATLSEAHLQAYITKLGPVGQVLREADEPTCARVTEAVNAAFAPYVVDGAARFTIAGWLVTARA
jgi:SAM-dependent methyltransferase